MLHRKLIQTLATILVLVAAPASAFAADLTIDRTKTYQSIEGFGFFGAADVWWSSASQVLDQAWTQKVIDDLGITMWRNEYYAAGTPQDADWAKQKPVVQALANYAGQKGVKLKILLTVWSPPATMKCASDDNATCNSTPPTRPTDTKGGNTLDPAMRADLANWLVAGAQMYHDAGADLYAISFQNEPLFSEPYNSCVYSQTHYANTLAAIGPVIKAAFPDVKLFGSENMLGTECGKSPGTAFDPYWYTANIMKVPEALAAIDAFAVHGYVDGVTATATSKLASMWTSFKTGTAGTGKAIWMTETSGYTHTWPGTSSTPGPLDLAQAIYASLAYGNLSAWTYWQGSEKGGYTEYSLMAGANNPGKNYFVSKQFFRFIRPGAQRVDVVSSDPEVMVVAFQHPAMNALTIVAINTGSAAKALTLAGANLPADFHAFRTSSSENAADLGTVAADAISLPASSITTLVNGSYLETPGTTGIDGGAGTGGVTGGGGAGGSGGRSGAGGATSAGGAGGSGGRAGAGGATTTGTGTGTGGRAGAAASGGAIGAGGARATGGAPGAGGVAAAGGATVPDAAVAAGGAIAAGGAVGAGGASTAVGTSGAGGTTDTGGTATSAAVGKGGGGGCGCSLGGTSARTRASSLLLLAVAGLLFVRRRRRCRRALRSVGGGQPAPGRAADTGPGPN
jgi:glucuronoarabinoxylan endo-1,4-beta-xylanase